MDLGKVYFRALALLLVFVCISQLASGRTKAPLHTKSQKNRVPGHYIVVLKDDVDVNSFTSAFDASVLRGTSEGKIQHKYQHALKGFSAQLSRDTVEKLRNSKHVKYIEEDRIVRKFTTKSWGIDRVDQRDLPLDGNTGFLGDGEGTHIYVVDTGTQYSHQEFSGRTGDGVDLIIPNGDPGFDCDGHGTHCAGSAAGATFGIATKATIHSVRALDCEGYNKGSSIIDAYDWVAKNKQLPAVLSASLGGEKSQAENDVVENLVDMNIVVSVAAGNENTDACNTSPASAPKVITVGATQESSDIIYDYSNYGSCLDIFAPGVEILSSYIGSDTASQLSTGTSMACPHVSGAAAVLLGINKDLTPLEVTDLLVKGATVDKIPNPKNSPNLLLYIGKDTCMTRCNTPKDDTYGCQCDTGCTSRVPVDCCVDSVNLCGIDGGGGGGGVEPTSCNANLMQEGTVTSPNFPSPYDDDMNCATTITAGTGQVVALTFQRFELEEEKECTYDSLAIYDGSDDTAALLGLYCGTDVTSVLSSGRNLHLVFQSDDSNTFQGYEASVTFQQEPQATPCNADLNQEGDVTSPNYPRNYGNDKSCITTITAGPGQMVQLTFVKFDLEPRDSEGHCYDSLSIYDGSDFDPDYDYPIEFYCGQFLPDDITSSGQSLSLHFESDDVDHFQGFHALVKFVPA